MGLMDEVRSELDKPMRSSKIEEIRSKLSDSDYKEFLVALGDIGISQAALRRALMRRDVRIGVGTISMMRRAFIAGELDRTV